jgi:hypothetical protein
VSQHKENVLVVPITAITTNDNSEQVVLSVVNGELVATTITTGMRTSQLVEILPGYLTDGANIVRNAAGLQLGAAVVVR